MKKIEYVYVVVLFVSLLHLGRYIPELLYINVLANGSGIIDILLRLKYLWQIIEFKMMKDRKHKGVNSFLKGALEQMNRNDYSNNQIILQNASKLNLSLNAFIYNCKFKDYDNSKSVHIENTEEYLRELEQKSKKAKKNETKFSEMDKL